VSFLALLIKINPISAKFNTFLQFPFPGDKMSTSHVSLYFKRSLRLLASLALAAALVGCAGTLSRVQTWDGEAPEDGVAILETSGEIRVTAVNDNSVTNFLLDDLDLDYELLPGKNRIVFLYRSIWAKTQKTDDHESPVHVVTSEPQELTVDAQAGETYQLKVSRKPESRREAEVFAAAPEIFLMDASGEMLATATPLADSQGTPQMVADTEEGDDAPESQRATLEQLKALWDRATAEERQKFLGWVLD
jgi:uncharacterized protein YccT (UPF0319 family)